MSDTLNKPRVLLVDDDLSLANSYQVRLETEGFEVRQCNDGEQALQMVQSFLPDVVLMDIMMPKLNGFDTLDNLQQMPNIKGLKIVILSALGQPEDVERAKSLGASDYLVKSQVVISDVVARLRELLALSSTT